MEVSPPLLYKIQVYRFISVAYSLGTQSNCGAYPSPLGSGSQVECRLDIGKVRSCPSTLTPSTLSGLKLLVLAPRLFASYILFIN